MNIVDLVYRNARVFPEETAFVEIRSISKIRTEVNWKQFNERTNSLANALIKERGQKGRQGFSPRKKFNQLA